MSKHHLRKSKECLNCGTIVSERYCSHCGQENTETRQTFGHLARHFFEDLTHYDSGFWRTIKYLLFRPALLTKEYLAGKRMNYVPPVRLYIFISFLCFFFPAILPAGHDFREEKREAERLSHGDITIEKTTVDTAAQQKVFKTGVIWNNLSSEDGFLLIPQPNDYVSVAQMDSMQSLLPLGARYNKIEHWMAQKTIEVHAHNSPRQVAVKLGQSFAHNLSKVLFIYMPLFALALWFFHKKKKWMYFDHAIFTLHYFSFMLLQISLFLLIRSIGSFLPYDIYQVIIFGSLAVLLIWVIYYFFRAHHKMYGEFWAISSFKSILLFVVNSFFMLSLLIGFIYYALFTLH